MEIEIGLDIGFGDVKIVAKVFTNPQAQMVALKYPTAIAYSKKGVIGNLGGNEDEYEFNGQSFVVGNAALQCEDLFSTRDIEFLLTYSPLLAYKALADLRLSCSFGFKQFVSAKKKLCLGLPLAYYSKKDKIEEALSGYTVSGNIVRFDAIEVRAQGQGIFFDYVLDEDGQPIKSRMNETVLVLDVGFNTVDVLGIVDGTPNKEWSAMLEKSGVCRICQALQDHLQTELDFLLSEQVIKDIVQKGHISLYGAARDLSTPIRKAKERYSEWLSREVDSRWDKFLKSADKLIVAGGGAYYIDHLKQKYPEQFLYVPHDPEYSNARGFLKFGMYVL